MYKNYIKFSHFILLFLQNRVLSICSSLTWISGKKNEKEPTIMHKSHNQTHYNLYSNNGRYWCEDVGVSFLMNSKVILKALIILYTQLLQ